MLTHVLSHHSRMLACHLRRLLGHTRKLVYRIRRSLLIKSWSILVQDTKVLAVLRLLRHIAGGVREHRGGALLGLAWDDELPRCWSCIELEGWCLGIESVLLLWLSYGLLVFVQR